MITDVEGILVVLQPMGPIDPGLLRRVAARAQERLPIPSRFTVNIHPVQPPLDTFDWDRRQYRADLVNSVLASLYDEVLDGGVYVLGVVEGDGYVPGLNFVFGLTSRGLRVASIYTARLRLPGGLLEERLTKLVLHELGHLLGLGHCRNPKCVMLFSNSLRELDSKSDKFCGECALKLKKAYEDIARG